MIIVADAIRLMLFPALMAFAASSDLLTMTISNRASLILFGGFFALAAMAGINAADMVSHLSAGCVVLVAAFGLLSHRIIGGGAAELASAAAVLLRLCLLSAHLGPGSLRRSAVT